MKPTLFLLSGLLCDDVVWTDQVAALQDLVDVRPVGFRGHQDLSVMAKVVLRQAPERFLVAGHSMGGRVALEVARYAPERVASLALLDTGVHAPRMGEHQDRQALLAIARENGMAALADKWIPAMVHPRRLNDGRLMRVLTDMVMRYTVDDFAGHVRAMLYRPDATQALAAYPGQTLIACGRQDRWAPLEQHQAMAAMSERCDLLVVDDSGQMVTMEQPEATATLLCDWVEGSLETQFQ
jgi:pimeloyl-ACP methyl ester carboxylesterase